MSSGYDVYKDYIELKLHFTREAFVYGTNHTRAARSSFLSRRDRYYFEKLAQKKDYRNILISCLTADGGSWIGDIAGEQGQDIYTEWLSRQQSLRYVFTTDLGRLDSRFDDNFSCGDVPQHSVGTANTDLFGTVRSEPELSVRPKPLVRQPKLLRLFLGKLVRLESVVILNGLTNFSRYWDKQLSDDPVWQSERLRVIKYQPFVAYKKDEYKKIVVDKFRSTSI